MANPKQLCSIQEFIFKKYAHKYVVKNGDTLSDLALKFGYKNPGPIYAFPLNRNKINKKNNYLIKTNDILYIPWHPIDLEKMNHAYCKLIHQANSIGYDTLDKLKIAKSNIDSTLLTVDLFSMNFGIFRKALMLPKELSEEAAKKWVENFLLDDIIRNVYPIIYSNLKGFKEANLYFQFIIRGAIEFKSPSFLATSILGFYEKDKELFLGGVDSYQKKIMKKITLANKRYINKLNRTKDQIEKQINMKFYREKIKY